KEYHGVLLVKHENVDRMVQDLVGEKDALQKRVDEAEKRLSKSEAAKERVKAEVSSMKSKLADAEKLLLSGSADVVEVQNLRTKTAELEEANKKFQDKLQTRDNELKYTRTEYQRASQAAVEAVAEKAELEKIAAGLRVKLESQLVQLKQMTWDKEREAKDAEIKKHRDRIVNLEDSIRRMQFDKQNTRGRYGVRSSSVPRRGISPATRAPSPAVATPTSAAAAHQLQNVQGV
ncbi:hypothetical protein V1512DRAFT_210044, partial [Lipomyces arxii]|uniref:uncharacterized protein n=1 Tax=Lipomyces arxii TaxID=56418 RepID=UPI0034CFA742